MNHIDALSRHVGAVVQGGTLEKEDGPPEQDKDTFCLKQSPGTYASRKDFFRDDDDVLYRRRPKGEPQMLVPATLVHEVILLNHDPVYVAHPGTKRTRDLIVLQYWWPGMRKAIEDYARKCYLCQRRKGTREFVAPLREVLDPTAPFKLTAMDVTGPFRTTPRGNKYLLTFIDHFSKYVEAVPTDDQTAETCARVYATQIVSRYGTGAQLNTDQGPAFMSSFFFQETYKVLCIRKIRTTSYHPASNGMLKRWHKDLHTALSHYINAANTNWDTIAPFFLMAHRAQTHSVTGYSPFSLLHGPEMQLPGNDNLKARCVQESTILERRIENLKFSLRMAYKEVAKANRKAHQRNKRFYDRKAKARHFEENYLVYLYTPAMKAGLTRKFKKFWSGPYQVIRKVAEFNYEIVSQDNGKQIVHINRLKKCYNQSLWNPWQNQKTLKKPPKQKTKRRDPGEGEEGGFSVGPFPLVTVDTTPENDCTTAPISILDTPTRTDVLWTPLPQVKTTLATVRLTHQDRVVSYKPPARNRQLLELARETCCKMLTVCGLVKNEKLWMTIRAPKMIDITDLLNLY